MIKKSLYFIAITPPLEIRQEIHQITEKISLQYDTSKALNSEPHITLVPPFWYPDPKIDRLKSTLSQLRMDIEKFAIELDGYDTFPRRVLFIKVTPSTELTECYDKTLGYLPEDLRLQIKTYRDYHPHITIAFKDISQENFEQAKEEYLPQPYLRVFEDFEITLYRHNGKRWKNVKV